MNVRSSLRALLTSLSAQTRVPGHLPCARSKLQPPPCALTHHAGPSPSLPSSRHTGPLLQGGGCGTPAPAQAVTRLPQEDGRVQSSLGSRLSSPLGTVTSQGKVLRALKVLRGCCLVLFLISSYFPSSKTWGIDHRYYTKMMKTWQ